MGHAATMLMQTTAVSPGQARHVSRRIERITVVALFAVFWLAFELIFYSYLMVAQIYAGKEPVGSWIGFVATQFAKPSELPMFASTLFLCLALYEAMRTVAAMRRITHQVAAFLAALLAGSFGFSIIVSVAIAMFDGGTVALRDIVHGTLLWTAPIGVWTGLSLALAANGEVREREARLSALRAQAHEAHAMALRFQINPHFLYNTLNSISTLILERRNADADRMIKALAAFVERTISADPLSDVCLKDEIALQRLYLDIEQIRFSDRLAIDIDVPGELDDALMPALILQPLLENALKHGAAPVGEALHVQIGATREADLLVLEVRNDGCVGQPGPRGLGVGLPNVRARLESRFGADTRLDLISSGPATTVRLAMPLEYAA
jgi:two-component system, LytTR family, sensor kinase